MKKTTLSVLGALAVAGGLGCRPYEDPIPANAPALATAPEAPANRPHEIQPDEVANPAGSPVTPADPAKKVAPIGGPGRAPAPEPPAPR